MATEFLCPRCRMDFSGEPGFFCECGDRAPDRRTEWNAEDHGRSTRTACRTLRTGAGWYPPPAPSPDRRGVPGEEG